MANTKLPARLLDTSAIPALNVTGDLTVDTNTLKVDSTNNRVGIGISSPKTTLNLAANDSGQGPILTLENTDTSITTNDVLGQIDFYGNDGSTGGTGQKATIQAIALNGSGTSVGLSFGTSPFPDTTATERMRIDSSGKLLIGDTASHVDDLLQIETPASGGGHGIQIRRNDSNTDQGIGRIMFGNNTDTDLATISAKTDGSSDAAALLFSTQPNSGSSTERMRIQSSGNVGINRTSISQPSAGATTLAIQGTDNNKAGAIRLYSANDSVAAYIYPDSVSGLSINTSTSHPMVFRTAATERMRIMSDGQIRIGSGAAQRPIIQATNFGYSASYRVALLGSASNAYNTQGTGSVTLAMNYDPSGNSDSSFGGDGREILFRNGTQFVTPNAADNDFNLYNLVLKDGNVGIGTSAPASRLHISNNAASANDLTLLTLQNGNGTSDISTPDTFIDFEFRDSNTNVTPQARIGGHAGDGGDANTQELEGRGYLTFHTSNTSATSGVAAPPERIRVASEGYLEVASFSAQPDDTDTTTHRKIEFKANGAGYQTYKRDCFVQNNAGSVQYTWYKVTLGANQYGRGSNVKYTATWSTGHASGQGFIDGSFVCRARHDNARIDVHGHIVYSRQAITGSYYGWSHDPDITLYESTATGSSAGLYMRVQGSRTSGYDGAAIHALYLEIFGSRQDTHYQGIYYDGTSTPSDAGSAISRTILS